MRSRAETFLPLNNIEMSLFFNLHKKYVVKKLLEYIQPFSLGLHRNVAGQMVASCPGSSLQNVLTKLVCKQWSVFCILLE